MLTSSQPHLSPCEGVVEALGEFEFVARDPLLDDGLELVSSLCTVSSPWTRI